mmetsp:Transcript_4989/g.14678  ORF Transcript_4989/g.14678 Transcript_4989/m.14678 type:complete len:238 (-) Transcript_4989:178-891(-)
MRHRPVLLPPAHRGELLHLERSGLHLGRPPREVHPRRGPLPEASERRAQRGRQGGAQRGRGAESEEGVQRAADVAGLQGFHDCGGPGERGRGPVLPPERPRGAVPPHRQDAGGLPGRREHLPPDRVLPGRRRLRPRLLRGADPRGGEEAPHVPAAAGRLPHARARRGPPRRLPGEHGPPRERERRARLRAGGLRPGRAPPRQGRDAAAVLRGGGQAHVPGPGDARAETAQDPGHLPR